MKALVSRVRNLLLRPGAEWQLIRNEPSLNILFGYVGILAVIPPAAALLGRVLFRGNIPDSALSSSFGYLVLTNALWYVMYVVNVVITGAIIAAILVTVESRWSGLTGLKLAAYSFTPLFAAGILAVIPHLAWSIPLAIAYGVYLLYLGIRALTPATRKGAIGYTVASFLAAAVIVGVMNLFEYYFESLVVKQLFL